MASRSGENVAQLKYLGMTVTTQHFSEEKIWRRMNCGNVCYCLVQYHLSSHLLSKNLKIRIYKTVIFPMVVISDQAESRDVTGKYRVKNCGESYTDGNGR
jgi:hypothetical protein